FVFVRLGLDRLPPLLFATLRFALAASFVLVVARPRLPWRVLLALGLTLGAAQFGLLFVGMAAGVAPGLASFLLHNQAFFTIGLGWWVLSERLRGRQLVGAGLGALGLGLLIASRPGHAAVFGVVCVLAGAVAAAAGNILLKRAGGADMLGVVVWSSLFAPIPLLVLSWVVEGRDRIAAGIAAADGMAVFAVFYAAVPSTIVAYAIWGKLFRLYGTSTVAPFFLLVPVVAVGLSATVLGQGITPLEAAACALILAGLACAVLPALPQTRAVTSS
ncbi:MAG TPA: EamA family transporter, partial [Methylomirabilota bacterium]|nr:EamA family transporter [Methylomirabilota bacterium]